MGGPTIARRFNDPIEPMTPAARRFRLQVHLRSFRAKCLRPTHSLATRVGIANCMIVKDLLQNAEEASLIVGEIGPHRPIKTMPAKQTMIAKATKHITTNPRRSRFARASAAVTMSLNSLASTVPILADELHGHSGGVGVIFWEDCTASTARA
jgi:hypothetical protein